ncbi:hypothetical protein QBC43DRAFT_39393 [Cladorrhinum sp. PSN259]|nr:hypothetical protein QBC43DRAFT_39393 [Cladorrhinum sp. PSN259]
MSTLKLLGTTEPINPDSPQAGPAPLFTTMATTDSETLTRTPPNTPTISGFSPSQSPSFLSNPFSFGTAAQRNKLPSLLLLTTTALLFLCSPVLATSSSSSTQTPSHKINFRNPVPIPVAQSPPQPQLQSAAGGGGVSGGQYEPHSLCPPPQEGQWNCLNSGSSWQRCASGSWSNVMSAAEGTRCTPLGLSFDMRVESLQQGGSWGNDNGGSDNGCRGRQPPRYYSGASSLGGKRVVGITGMVGAVVLVVGVVGFGGL